MVETEAGRPNPLKVPASPKSRLSRIATSSNFSLTGKRAIPKIIPEEDWQRYTGFGVLFPLGYIKFRWDLMMLVLILYSCISVPFRLGMHHLATGGWWYAEVLISLAFITDVVLSFNTAIKDGDQLILDKSMIRDRYIAGWFVPDALSSLPMELVDVVVLLYFPHLTDEKDGHHNFLRWIRALRLVRMLRLLRLYAAFASSLLSPPRCSRRLAALTTSSRSRSLRMTRLPMTPLVTTSPSPHPSPAQSQDSSLHQLARGRPEHKPPAAPACQGVRSPSALLASGTAHSPAHHPHPC